MIKNLIPILFEDQDVLTISKPAGLVVNRADTVTEPTVQDWLQETYAWARGEWEGEWQSLVPEGFAAEYGTPEEIFRERVGVAHRLDKDTSGALVIAKNPGSLVALLRAFKQREVAKQYTCLVHGKVKVEHDVLSWPIARASHSKLQFGVDVAGRPAETEYQVKHYYPGLLIEDVMKLPEAAGHNFRKKASLYQGFTLIDCWPKTGRTHQIRVHFAHMKHPLVGDQTYAGKKRQALDRIWCPRHFLHAARITFSHPRTHESLTIEAPLPEDLEQVLAWLRSF